ncbi:MAG: Fe-S cluster assembly protein SufD [Proteobacteria bacterium]|nr:Fe-S cluster assembly protein SufD [Pseudomonadota bacterium]
MSPVTPDRIRDIVGRLPTTREEDWRYTDLARAKDISTRWLDAGAAAAPLRLADTIDRVTAGIGAAWIVIANGRLHDLPSVGGVELTKLDSAPGGDSALAELNAALLVDGVRIRIADEPDEPIGLLFVDGTDAASISQAYVQIDVAPNASAEFIEYHLSLGEADQYANTIVSIDVGDNASVRHVRVQARSLNHLQTGRSDVSVGRDARFASACFDLGGGLVRNDLAVDIAKPGAEAAFDGLYLAGDGQHIDNHTRVDHRVGPATSRQEYRGILNGNCRCVWNGKAIVHEAADGTDADQANHNLLLSTKAEIDAKPELEIYTDDVKCSHGATVGQLDEAALFYLRSRGLDERHATEVLTHAFAAGLVSRIPVEAARHAVAALMADRLGALTRSDEVFGV